MGNSKLWLARCPGVGFSLVILAELEKIERLPLQPSWTVCLSGCPYTSIQAAIDNSPEGATITVGPGSYQENVFISKSLRIIGSGPGVSILQPQPPTTSLGKHIEIRALQTIIQVWLEGFTLRNSYAGMVGIDSKVGGHLMLHQLEVSDYDIGVNGDNIFLDKVTITQNAVGLAAYGKNIVVTRSTISRNEIGIECRNCVVLKSSILENSRGILITFVPKHLLVGRLFPVDMLFYQDQVRLEDNTIEKNGTGIEIGLSWSGSPPSLRPVEIDPPLDLLVMKGNNIVENDYGILIQEERCGQPQGHKAPRFMLFGYANEIRKNKQSDLCPADYPWPTASKKP